MIYPWIDIACIAAMVLTWYRLQTVVSQIVLAEVLLTYSIHWAADNYLSIGADPILQASAYFYAVLGLGFALLGRKLWMGGLYLFAAAINSAAVDGDAFYYGLYGSLSYLIFLLILAGCLVDKYGRDIAIFCSDRLNIAIKH